MFVPICFRVKNWALKFGVDLWEFGRQITNMNEIQKVSFLNSTRENINIILYIQIIRYICIFTL